MKICVKLVIFFLALIFSVQIASAQTAEAYTWKSLPLGGGGFVSAVIAHPTTANVIYARTDVGGLYRWENATKTWTPLTDWVSTSEMGFLGVESVALDPQKPQMVYALVGLSYFNSGKTAILKSSDYGATFTTVVVTSQFTAHGNGEGRQTGERLAVDPNNSNILYCGTRSSGLFKSTDAGLTWAKVTAFPVSTTGNGNGICIVQFDGSSVSGGVTQKIYAGISQTGTSVYVSTNGGTSWAAVSGQPTTYMPHRMALSSGTLYITYANGGGPSIGSAGGYVYKYAGTTWTPITPSGTAFNYGGISVVGSTILVSSIGMWYSQPTWPSGSGTPYGDRIFISTNGGTSWVDLMGNSLFAYNNNSTPWITNHALHWTGCATLDPFNTSRAFVTSGNGLFMTENLSSTALSTWKFMCKGLEETVPLDMVSTANGYPVTVIGDYDGSVYTDMVTNPTLHNPEIGTSTGIASAPDNSLMVRVGGKNDGSNFPIYYSTNKGVAWTAFATKPGTYYQGNVGVSANGATVLWSPSNTNTIYKTTNKGTSWATVSGISLSGAYPVGDQVNANKFYITNGNTVYVSTDAGSTFSAKGTTATGAMKKIRAVPGVEGDVWAPCGTGGLYRSTNSGTSFTKLTTVAACTAVGFGKIASGKTFPTVFIWGTVGTTEGIFKSIDAGATWIRINDDAHEFGGTANGEFVIGDMNTSGTVYVSTAGRGVMYGIPASTGVCSQPNLGIDTSLCGITTPHTLNSNTTTATNVTYSWYKDGTVISGATSPTYAISSAGTYKVVRDSSTCSRNDEVIVTAVIPAINLGADQEICATASITLDAGITKAGHTYQWQKNAVNISGATSRTYSTSTAGTYKCTVSATSCTAVSDEVIVTSKMLAVTPDTVCASGGVATLTVTTAGGPYEWYNVATNGTALSTGTTYSPSITSTTTYYVKDIGGVASTIGKVTRDASSTNGWYTSTFTDLTSMSTVEVLKNITLESISVDVQSVGNVTIRFMQGTTVAYTYTATNVAAGMQVIPVNFNLVPGAYTIDAFGTTIGLYLQTDMASYPYSLATYISFSNAESWATTWYSLFYNWKLKVGNSCARTPVIALVDGAVPCADTQAPSTPGVITCSAITTTGMTATWSASTDNIAVTGYEVYVNGVLHSTVTTTSITLTGLTCNTAYAIKVRAKDAVGNYSAYNTEETNTTSGIALPTVITPVIYCQNSTAIPLTATGTALKWYTVETGGTSSATAPTPVTTSVGTVTYYVSQTISSCESSRSSIEVITAAKPASITSIVSTDSDSTLCPAGTTILSSTVTQSNATDFEWIWYKSSVSAANIVGATPVTASVAPNLTVDFADASTYILLVRNKTYPTLLTCQSQKSKSISQAPIPTYTITGGGTICEGASIPAVIINLTGNQPFEISWIQTGTVSNSGNPIVTTSSYTIPSLPSNVGTYSYLISGIKDKFCTGIPTTNNVNIVINFIPAAPTVTTPISYSQGAIASALTASGTGLLWYTSATGGTGNATAPIPSTASIGTTNYYVSQTVNGCESARTQIVVNIVTAIVTQTITLQSGWNLISTYFTAPDNSIATLLSTVDYTLIKNADGFYKKGQNAALQSLQTIEAGKGYLIYVNTPIVLSISGTALTSYTSQLQTGWNMVGVASSTAKSVSTLPIETITLKDFDGFYEPANGMSTITELTPTKGYFIKVSSTVNITW